MKTVIAIALFCFSSPVFAQINEFKDKTMTFRAYVEVPTYTIQLESKDTGAQIQWQPNIRELTGVDVSFNNFITAGIGWANDDIPGSAATKGVTNYTDYRLALTRAQFRIEGNFQQFTGFYVANTPEIDPVTAATGVYIQDGSMTGNNISVNATWVDKPENFSYTAAIGQDARQDSSGGSLLYGLAAADTGFSSGNYLIPSIVRGSFGADQNIKNAQFYSLDATIGYGYTFAWHRSWFVSVALNLGLGGEYCMYGNGVTGTTTGGVSTKANFLFSLGYNGDDFLAAIIASGDDTTYSTNSLSVPSLLADAKFAIGVHL